MEEKNELVAELLTDCYKLSEEFFEKGEVSQNTLLILAARTRLLVMQAKAEMAAEEAQEEAQEAKSTTRGTRPTGQRKRAQKRACVHCGKRLKGRQRKFCSKGCANRYWQRKHPEKQRAYQRAYIAKKKAA